MIGASCFLNSPRSVAQFNVLFGSSLEEVDKACCREGESLMLLAHLGNWKWIGIGVLRRFIRQQEL